MGLGGSPQVQVFISYPAPSRDLAIELARALRDKGLSIWQDLSAIKPGENWTERIEKALREVDAVVVLLQPGRKTDPRQDYELTTALERVWEDPSTPLIPLVIGDAELPAFLINRAGAFFRLRKKGENFDELASEIATSLHRGQVSEQQRTATNPEEDLRRRSRLREIKKEIGALKPRRSGGGARPGR